MNWIKKFQKHSWTEQDELTAQIVRRMEEILLAIADKATDEYLEKGSYTKPSEADLYVAIESYYKTLVRKAYNAAQIAKQLQKPKMQSVEKKLAKLPLGIPNRLPPLVKFFADRRMWTKMQKRGFLIVKKLRTAYFKKLDKKFAQIGPDLQNGKISPADVKKELRNAWKATKSRVETIFQTETTNYFNKVQVSFYQDDEDIIGFLFQANRDGSTTDICRSRHGLVYRPGSKLLKKNTPACHYRCRSELIPLANTPANRKMLEDPSRDPEKRKVTPLPPGWVAGRKAA